MFPAHITAEEDERKAIAETAQHALAEGKVLRTTTEPLFCVAWKTKVGQIEQTHYGTPMTIKEATDHHPVFQRSEYETERWVQLHPDVKERPE